MMLRICYTLLLLCLNGGLLSAQPHAGIYADGYSIRLELSEDGTFRLVQPDPVFTNQFGQYRSEGYWSATGDTIRLNPKMSPRQPRIDLRWLEDVSPKDDSISIRLQYFVENYVGDSLLGTAPYPIEQVTIYLEKRRHGYNLVQDNIIRHCAFAPRVKKQVLPNAQGVFRLPANSKVERIGILTYGFTDVVWLPANGRNYYLSIIQPVEKHRTPRNKVAIMKKGTLYYHESRGKVRTGAMVFGLKRAGE